MSRRFIAALLVVTLLVSAVPAPAAAVENPLDASGMVGIADSNISENVPQYAQTKIATEPADLEGSVMTSEGASSLEVEVTTEATARGREAACQGQGATQPPYCENPQLALNFSDATEHSGRKVAVPVDVLEAELGYIPDAVYVTHESGDQYVTPTNREGNLLVWRIEEFSTNTVTFSGEAVIDAKPAVDGSSYTYNISTLDAVDNYVINVTGHTATAWDNETGSGVGPSSSNSISLAGNMDPNGPSGNGEPTLEVTEVPDVDYSPAEDEADGSDDNYFVIAGDTSNDASPGAGIQIQPDASGTVDEIQPRIGNTLGSDYGVTVDIYIVQESVDNTYGEGTLVKSGWDPDWSTGTQNITLDTAYSVSAGTTYTVEFVQSGTDSDGTKDAIEIWADTSASGTWYAYSSSSTNGAYADLLVDPARSVSGVSVADGNGLTKDLGDFTNGQTKTVEYDVTTSSTTLDFSGSGNGALDYTLHVEERTQTVDPTVEVNGNTTSYTGSLADGTTKSLTTDTSWVQAGENTVNVTVGDGTLSADAPTPSVDLDYSHDAEDKQSVDYDAEKWSERYNVSKTYAEATTNAELTIPFNGSVVKVYNVEKSVNDGTWQTVSSSSYSFDGTTLTVQLGDLNTDDKVEVRTTGRKVNVINGKITVTEPTTVGNRLDSKFRIDTWNTDAKFSLGSTPDGELMHYTYNESWGGGEYNVVHADGVHYLYLDGASEGSEARISTIPIKANAKTGEVRVSVPDPQQTEPQFHVEPGASSGDEVEFTFTDAADDQKYILYSKTKGIVRDSGTANSPLTLTDDDSDETLEFQQESTNTSSSDTGSIIGPIQTNTGGGPLNSVPIVLLAWGALVIALYYIDRGGSFAVRNPVPAVVPVVGGERFRIPLPGGRGPLFWVGSALSGVFVLEFLSSGLISRTVYRTITGVGEGLQQVVPALALLFGLFALYYLYTRYIKGSGPRPIVIRGDGGDGN